VCSPAASRKLVKSTGRNPETCSLRVPAPRDPIHADGGKRGCRGGVRTSVLSVLTLAALAAVVVIVLARSLGPPEQASPPGAQYSPEKSQRAPASDRPEITGTITVVRDLTGRVQDGSVLFVIAHKAAGPPFAVQRIVSPRFPLVYRLGPEDLMMAGAVFEGEVRVSARLSRTGNAGPAQPGDLEGDLAEPVRVGARNVDIAISRVR